MTRAAGGLSYLAIGAIFVVVLGTMYAGVQFSEGELLDREPASQTETELRAALWESIDAEHAERGLDPAARETSGPGGSPGE